MDGKALYKHNAEVSIVAQDAHFSKGPRDFSLSGRWAGRSVRLHPKHARYTGHAAQRPSPRDDPLIRVTAAVFPARAGLHTLLES